jgi:hypothetical protein
MPVVRPTLANYKAALLAVYSQAARWRRRAERAEARADVLRTELRAVAAQRDALAGALVYAVEEMEAMRGDGRAPT